MKIEVLKNIAQTAIGLNGIFSGTLEENSIGFVYPQNFEVKVTPSKAELASGKLKTIGINQSILRSTRKVTYAGKEIAGDETGSLQIILKDFPVLDGSDSDGTQAPWYGRSSYISTADTDRSWKTDALVMNDLPTLNFPNYATSPSGKQVKAKQIEVEEVFLISIYVPELNAYHPEQYKWGYRYKVEFDEKDSTRKFGPRKVYTIDKVTTWDEKDKPTVTLYNANKEPVDENNKPLGKKFEPMGWGALSPNAPEKGEEAVDRKLVPYQKESAKFTLDGPYAGDAATKKWTKNWGTSLKGFEEVKAVKSPLRKMKSSPFRA